MHSLKTVKDRRRCARLHTRSRVTIRMRRFRPRVQVVPTPSRNLHPWPVCHSAVGTISCRQPSRERVRIAIVEGYERAVHGIADCLPCELEVVSPPDPVAGMRRAAIPIRHSDHTLA